MNRRIRGKSTEFYYSSQTTFTWKTRALWCIKRYTRYIFFNLLQRSRKNAPPISSTNQGLNQAVTIRDTNSLNQPCASVPLRLKSHKQQRHVCFYPRCRWQMMSTSWTLIRGLRYQHWLQLQEQGSLRAWLSLLQEMRAVVTLVSYYWWEIQLNTSI